MVPRFLFLRLWMTCWCSSVAAFDAFSLGGYRSGVSARPGNGRSSPSMIQAAPMGKGRTKIPVKPASYWVIGDGEESFPPAGNNPWRSLCPSFWNSGVSKDVVMAWSREDDPEAVARAIVRELEDPPSEVEEGQRRTADLARSLEEFRGFCEERLQDGDGPPRRYRARIVATRGTAGTKCPQWHVDHVPVRWIQSLVGPGCDLVVGTAGIDRKALDRFRNGFDDDDGDDDGMVVQESTQERNQALVDERRAEVYSASEREALLVVGNRWNAFAKDPSEARDPAVHKSPKLEWGSGRVLLTQDVLLLEDHAF